MPLSETMTSLMNKARKITGLTDKLNLIQLTSLMDYLNFDRVNLLQGTSGNWKTITTSSGWIQKTSSSNPFTNLKSYSVGTQFTYAATINNTLKVPVCLQIWPVKSDGSLIPNGSKTSPIVQPGAIQTVWITDNVVPGENSLRTWIISVSGNAPIDGQVKVKGERLVEGPIPGTWSLNPADEVGGGN